MVFFEAVPLSAPRATREACTLARDAALAPPSFLCERLEPPCERGAVEPCECALELFAPLPEDPGERTFFLLGEPPALRSWRPNLVLRALNLTALDLVRTLRGLPHLPGWRNW